MRKNNIIKKILMLAILALPGGIPIIFIVYLKSRLLKNKNENKPTIQ